VACIVVVGVGEDFDAAREPFQLSKTTRTTLRGGQNRGNSDAGVSRYGQSPRTIE
jgi:hypothetical protein